MRQALEAIVEMVAGEDLKFRAEAESFRWGQLRGEHTLEIRQQLIDSYAPATVNKMLSALRGVLRAARKLRLMDKRVFAAAVSFENVPLDAPVSCSPLSNRSIKALFKVCAAEESARGRRDAALLATLLSSGLRRAEAVRLDVGDYDRKTGHLHVRSVPPGRDRHVEFSTPARRATADWLTVRGPRPGPLLFPVNKSGVICYRRLTDQAIYLILARLAAQAGLPHITSRELRRTYVVRHIAAGHDLEQVQHMVGHANYTTTALYREVADAQEVIGNTFFTLPYVSPHTTKRRT